MLTTMSTHCHLFKENTMTNKFAKALKKEDSLESFSTTENGAVGYSRTNSRLVDFFFKVGSMRAMDPNKISSLFAEAYAEDPLNAMKLMFFARDVRGGMGEKKVFNVCFDWLIRNYPGDAIDLLGLIPEYGSWKTFFDLTDSFQKNPKVRAAANGFVKDTWLKDIGGFQKDGKVSLMAKWLPSENASSKETKRLAYYWMHTLGIDPRTYRKALSKFRKAIQIVESDMSSGNWFEINYNQVPSKAGMIYRNAFLRHDETRRRKWLEDLANGKSGVKINTTGLTVADMVSKYLDSCPRYYDGSSGEVKYRGDEDPTIEAAWRDIVSKGMLPDKAPALLPVVDGSGSMYWPTPDGKRSIDVSIGLGLYLANTNTPAWRGMMIEYGSSPSFFKVPTAASLHSQVGVVASHNDCGSTNIEAVYDLLLKTVVKNGFSQEDIPTLVVFSDMEFNGAMCSDCNVRLMDLIAQKWRNAGYLLPRMIFWNINSRTGTIPLVENELGVSLLSGYSQSIMDMVLSRKLDPMEVLLEKLGSSRYTLIEEALK